MLEFEVPEQEIDWDSFDRTKLYKGLLSSFFTVSPCLGFFHRSHRWLLVHAQQTILREWGTKLCRVLQCERFYFNLFVFSWETVQTIHEQTNIHTITWQLDTFFFTGHWILEYFAFPLFFFSPQGVLLIKDAKSGNFEYSYQEESERPPQNRRERSQVGMSYKLLVFSSIGNWNQNKSQWFELELKISET